MWILVILWNGRPGSSCSPRLPLLSPGSGPDAHRRFRFRVFSLFGFSQHDLLPVLGLLGIESPGLTASLALARLVADRLA